MYDYISLQSDNDYSKSISVDQLQKIFHETDGFIKRTSASGLIQLGDFKLVLQGVKCGDNGNYAFENDAEFEAINLIEINIPQGAESAFEDEIRQIANEISNKIGWQIDWRE